MRVRIIMMVLLAVAAGGCTSPPPKAPAPAPSSPASTTQPPIDQAHMTWVEVMCRQRQRLAVMKARRPDPRNGPLMAYVQYIGASANDIGGVVDQLALLAARPLGKRTADELVRKHLQEGQRIGKEVRPFTSGEALTTGDEALQRRRADRVARLVASMTSLEPGLETAVRQDPILTRAYDRAPECKLAPPPTTSSP